MKTTNLIVSAFLCTSPAYADITLRFDEGAPKDRFTLTNDTSCVFQDASLKIDLSTAATGLVFDVTGSGAGVEVFQPFELVAGKDALTTIPVIKDGDSAIVLQLANLAPAQSVAFTIDVDDTGTNRQITVTDAEFQGAGVTLALGNETATGMFGDDAKASIAWKSCTS